MTPTPPTTTGSTDVATDPSTADETTEPAPPDEPKRIPIRELRKGDVLGPQQCRELRRGVIVFGDKPRADIKVKELETTLDELATSSCEEERKGNSRWYLAVQAGKRWISVDRQCTVVSVDKFPETRGHR